MFFRAKPAAPIKPAVCSFCATHICSFCGKGHTEVRKLIAGGGGNICDRCVMVCKELLDKESEREEVALANAETLT